jgi:hypothetical protein
LHLEVELIERLTDADDDVQQAARLALVYLSHGLGLGPELGAGISAEKDRSDGVRRIILSPRHQVPFASSFTAPTFHRFTTSTIAAILTSGRRMVQPTR